MGQTRAILIVKGLPSPGNGRDTRKGQVRSGSERKDVQQRVGPWFNACGGQTEPQPDIDHALGHRQVRLTAEELVEYSRGVRHSGSLIRVPGQRARGRQVPRHAMRCGIGVIGPKMTRHQRSSWPPFPKVIPRLEAMACGTPAPVLMAPHHRTASPPTAACPYCRTAKPIACRPETRPGPCQVVDKRRRVDALPGGRNPCSPSLEKRSRR
jgi:hypothetical protein